MRPCRRRPRWAPLNFHIATALATASLALAASASPAGTALFHFADSRIAESSGLASSSFDATLYTHNDSGDTARFFRVDEHGNTVAVYTLRGATNVDWEDMARATDAAGKSTLYFADTGNNTGARSVVDIYETPEPHGPSADVPWVRYRFAYPDGPHDCEALMVDPRSGRIYLATKVYLGSGELYAAPAVPNPDVVNQLAPLRSVPALTTSAAFSPDGERFALLTYLGAYWAAGLGGALHPFSVPLQRQNEAITFSRDGSAVLVGSEGLHSAVFQVPLPRNPPTASASSSSVSPGSTPPASTPPASTPPASTPPASTPPASTPPRTGQDSHGSSHVVRRTVIVVGAILVFLLVVGTVVIARFRRRDNAQ